MTINNGLYANRKLVRGGAYKNLLPKLPHWVNVLIGGHTTMEPEHTYGKDGNILLTEC